MIGPRCVSILVDCTSLSAAVFVVVVAAWGSVNRSTYNFKYDVYLSK